MDGRAICRRCKDRAWRAAHPEHHLFKNLKTSAKRRGIEFALTLEEFTVFCARENFVERVGRGKDSATIDRRDPTRGYHADNLRVLSNSENSRLGSALAGTGHRTPGQQSMHYAPEENPLYV